MVYFFKSNVTSPGYILYMGVDKYENEELLRWGWPEDVWFHGQTLEEVPLVVIEDAAQLVKANSIEGNKINNIEVVYTMWENLKKTSEMVTGQVGYHKNENVRQILVEKRLNIVINRLNKTRTIKNPDFQFERQERDANERRLKRQLLEQTKKKEKEMKKLEEEQAKLRNYSCLMKDDKMKTNYDDGNDSDDFM